MLQRYKQAKINGVKRPRLPLYIPLRDYAKAISIESLFSEFFFRKHEILIPGYSAFEKLNRMGKFVLIFDGFDEMAAQVDRQKMINNFWELARAVVPRTKIILTCRTEHFPEAKEGRELLQAELKASTSNLSGEPPQFEVLELQQLNEIQIRKLLSSQTSTKIIQRILKEPHLLNLVRRPIMVDLILEAMPEIEEGEPIDLAHIYLFAVQRKMDRDIRAERTFTSLAEKLYFLCELSWEMLSTDRMRLNYREFPNHLRRLFPHAIKEQKDLDHWHYDMMAQTMLVRNADGDYTPAHRSLLEFFVAYKFAAELGALLPKFIFPARSQSFIDNNSQAQNYTWSQYFLREIDEAGRIAPIPPLERFNTEPLTTLANTFGAKIVSKAILTLMEGMVDQEILWGIVKDTSQYNSDPQKIGYTGGNAITLLQRLSTSFSNAQLENTVLTGADLFLADLNGANLQGAILNQVTLTGCTLENTDLRGANLADLQLIEMGRVYSLAWSSDGSYLASGSDDANVRIWDAHRWEQITVLQIEYPIVSNLVWSPNDKFLVAISKDFNVTAWNPSTWETIDLPDTLTRTNSICFSPDCTLIAGATFDGPIVLYDARNFKELVILEESSDDDVQSLAFSPDEKQLVAGFDTGLVKIWNSSTGELLREYKGSLVSSKASVSKISFHEKKSFFIYRKHLDVLMTNEIDINDVSVNFMENDYHGAYDDAFNRLYNEIIDKQSEVYYLNNKKKFKKMYSDILSEGLDDELVSELKYEFLKETNRSLLNEIEIWVDNSVRTHLSNLNDPLVASDYPNYDQSVDEQSYVSGRFPIWQKRVAVGLVERWDLIEGRF